MATKDSTALRTIDHEKIRDWIEERGGRPSVVADTWNGTSGMLRVDFENGDAGEILEEISWNDFFRIFDENNLEFLYQEKTVDGRRSRFCKFTERDEAREDD